MSLADDDDDDDDDVGALLTSVFMIQQLVAHEKTSGAEERVALAGKRLERLAVIDTPHHLFYKHLATTLGSASK
jgi:hypothetical protein